MALEKAAWYKDEFGSHMADKNKREKKEYAAPEMLYDLDGEHTVKSLSERPGKGYAGTPGAATINLRGHRNPEVVNLDKEDDDDMSALSTKSKEELIAILRKGKISSKKGLCTHRCSAAF